MTFQRIGEAKLDERLARDADALGFLIDGLEEIDREIHVHTLDFTSRAARPRIIEARCHVATSVVQGVELFGRHSLNV